MEDSDSPDIKIRMGTGVNTAILIIVIAIIYCIIFSEWSPRYSHNVNMEAFFYFILTCIIVLALLYAIVFSLILIVIMAVHLMSIMGVCESDIDCYALNYHYRFRG